MFKLIIEIELFLLTEYATFDRPKQVPMSPFSSEVRRHVFDGQIRDIFRPNAIFSRIVGRCGKGPSSEIFNFPPNNAERRLSEAQNEKEEAAQRVLGCYVSKEANGNPD